MLKLYSSVKSVRSRCTSKPYNPLHISSSSPYVQPSSKFQTITTPSLLSTPIALHTRSRRPLSQAMALPFSQLAFLSPMKSSQLSQADPSNIAAIPQDRVVLTPIPMSQYSPPTAITGAIPKRLSRHYIKTPRKRKKPYN